MVLLHLLSTLRSSHAGIVNKLLDEIGSLKTEIERLKEQLQPPPPPPQAQQPQQMNPVRLIKNTLPPRVISRAKQILSTSPFSSMTTQAVIVILDIKGFTKLSERFAKKGFDNGIEKFSTLVNSFFTDLISILHQHHGQIESFNGDALIIMFFADESLFPWSFESMGVPFYNPLRYALQCIHAIRSCGSFTPWRTTADNEDVELRLHGAVALGDVEEVYVGGWKDRYLSIASSGCFGELSKALDATGDNEYILAQSALDVLKQTSNLGGSVVVETDKFVRIEACRFLPTFDSGSTDGVDDDDSDLTFYSRFVPSSFFLKRITSESVTKGDFFNERRFVAVLFISIGPTSISELQRIVCGIQVEMDAQDGTIRQLTQDDKGVVMICAFGFPFHVDDCFRAVHAAYNISTLSQSCTIGVTAGECFAGCCGSSNKRFEWSIIGTTVNMAARFAMKCGSLGEKVLLSEVVEELCVDQDKEGVIEFCQCEKLQLKGIADPVQAFSPRLAVRREAHRSRLTEETIIGATFLDVRAPLTEAVLSSIPSSPFVVIQGEEAGIGKSFLVSRVRERLGNHAFTTFATSCLIDKKYTSYFVLTHLLRDIVDCFPSVELEPILTLNRQHSHPDIDAMGSYDRAQLTLTAFGRVITHVCTLTPRLLLILDNIHNIDQLSLNFVTKWLLSPALRPANCHVLLTFTKISDGSDDFKMILKDSKVFDLRPFTQEESDAFISDISKGKVTTRKYKKTFETARGIPTDLLNVYHALYSHSDTDRESDSSDVLSASSTSSTSLDPHEKLEKLIYAEIDRLTGIPYMLIKLASVLSLGTILAFNPSLLQRASRLSDSDNFNVNVDRLIDLNIFVREEKKLRFASALFSQCAYKMQTKSNREEIHRLVPAIVSEIKKNEEDVLEFCCKHRVASTPITESEVFESVKSCHQLANILAYNGNDVDAGEWLSTSLSLLKTLSSLYSTELLHLELLIQMEKFQIEAREKGRMSFIFGGVVRIRELALRLPPFPSGKAMNYDELLSVCVEATLSFNLSLPTQLEAVILHLLEALQQGKWLVFENDQTRHANVRFLQSFILYARLTAMSASPYSTFLSVLGFLRKHDPLQCKTTPLFKMLMHDGDDDDDDDDAFVKGLNEFEELVMALPLCLPEIMYASNMEYSYMYFHIGAMSLMQMGCLSLSLRMFDARLRRHVNAKKEADWLAKLRNRFKNHSDQIIERSVDVGIQIFVQLFIERLWEVGEYGVAESLYDRDDVKKLTATVGTDLQLLRWKLMGVLFKAVPNSPSSSANLSDADMDVLNQIESVDLQGFQVLMCDFWSKLGNRARLAARLEKFNHLSIQRSGELYGESEYLRFKGEMEANDELVRQSLALALERGCWMFALRSALSLATRFGKVGELRTLCGEGGQLRQVMKVLERERRIGVVSENLTACQMLLESK